MSFGCSRSGILLILFIALFGLSLFLLVIFLLGLFLLIFVLFSSFTVRSVGGLALLRFGRGCTERQRVSDQ